MLDQMIRYAISLSDRATFYIRWNYSAFRVMIININIYWKNVSSCGNWLGESFLLELKMS